VNRAGLKTLLGGYMAEAKGIVEAGNPWWGNPAFTIKYDPAAARKLMTEAGYSAAKPVKVKVQVSASGSGQMQPLPMNEYVQQNLKECFFDVDFDVVEWNTLFTNWRIGAKDASAHGANAINVSFAAMDPFFAMVRFVSTKTQPPVSNNWGYFGNAEFDKLIETARTSFGEKERCRAGKTHARIVEEAPFVLIAHDVGPRAISRKVKGWCSRRAGSSISRRCRSTDGLAAVLLRGRGHFPAPTYLPIPPAIDHDLPASPHRICPADPAWGRPALLLAGPHCPRRSPCVGAAARCIRDLRRQLTALYGFDKPFLEQFLHWAARCMGTWYVDRHEPARDERGVVAVVNSVRLAAVATLIGFTFGCLFGFVAGYLRDSVPDRVASFLSVLGVSIPHYWLGMVLVIAFSVLLGWLPATGAGPNGSGDWRWDWEHIQYMLLPAVTMSVIPMGIVARTIRALVAEILSNEFIVGLRARGLSDLAVFRHVVKNVTPTALPVMGLQLGYLLGGSILIETVFSWPGTGFLLNSAIFQRDFPLLQGTILVLAVFFVMLNLLVDALQTLFDPRIQRN
jgi:peptide/nickel transport system permease protein